MGRPYMTAFANLSPASRRWLIIIGAWTAYGLANSTLLHFSWVTAERPKPYWFALILQMPQAWIWALATPGIQRLGRIFPFNRRRWYTSFLIHLVISLAFVFCIDLGYAWHVSNTLPVGRSPLGVRAFSIFLSWALADGMLYWTVLIMSWALDSSRRVRERELTASQLETQLAQADLQALRAQLHPHFLFNALHTISSLVRTGDRDAAVRVTAGLGDLLRRVLEGGAQHEVPLREELDFIKSYLEIEQVRFRDRLHVVFQVEPEALTASVPHLILQPLVENAIRHGIAPHLFAGLLVVGAKRDNGRLSLYVRDDGPGVGDGDGARPGIGLTNTRARLSRLYGDDYLLEVTNASGGGLQATVELPYHVATAEWERAR